MPLEDYVLHALAAEMPGNYETEALKAQAVAARTYALKKQLTGGCSWHKGCDVCDSPAHCQAYATDDDMRYKWGALYPVLRAKLTSAVNQTRGEVILYDGQPIDALYHAASQGKTENSGEVFLTQLPYLVSVDTPEAYETQITIPFSRAASYTGQNYVSSAYVLTTSGAGRAKSVVIGNKTFTGSQIRSLFSLKSTDFSITTTAKGFVFTVRGYGHGVGMSQYGANAYAKQGWSYTEILQHYYTGVSIATMP